MALVVGEGSHGDYSPRASTPVGALSSNEEAAPNPQQNPFEQAAALISQQHKHTFCSPAEVVKFVLEREGCYMLITRVSVPALARIETAFERRGLRAALRFTYENATESLIIKYMPGVAHEVTAIGFSSRIMDKIAQLPGHSLSSIIGLGTAQFGIPGRRSKQGDAAIKPATRIRITDWPSLVIEVGHSESLPHLRNDARMWLLNSPGKTKIVILVKISKDLQTLHVENWQMVLNGATRVTTGFQSTVPGAVQRFKIHSIGTIDPVGTQLTIPYLTVFDVPVPNASGIIFTTNDLLILGRDIFRGLQ